MTGLLIVLGILLLFVGWAVGIYNGLVVLRNGFKNAFAQIDVQLKRRYDLIPNLVETAKGYMKHERETLEAVVSARNQASAASQKAAAAPGDPNAMKSLVGAESALSGAMTKFFAVAEAYPDLKANQNMAQLMQELSSTENMIASARQTYNNAATAYNVKRQIFPNVIVANMFAFQEAVLFEITVPQEREAVKVSF